MRQINFGMTLSLLLVTTLLISGCSTFKPEKEVVTVTKLVERNIPLPLGLINNLRSMVALDNIVNFILDCIFNKQAINKTFLISDNHDLSTPQLIERLSDALGLKCKLYNISPIIFKMFTFLIGKRDIYEKINGSLQVDINQTMQISGWTPVVSIDDQLSKLVHSNHG